MCRKLFLSFYPGHNTFGTIFDFFPYKLTLRVKIFFIEIILTKIDWMTYIPLLYSRKMGCTSEDNGVFV